MVQAIKDMLSSKKFQATLFGILALVFTALSGNMEWVEVLDKGWVLILGYVGAQGVADFGKEKAKVEAAAAALPDPELPADK